MDYEQMQAFFNWAGENPVLGTITVIGGIALVIVLIFFLKRLDKRN